MFPESSPIAKHFQILQTIPKATILVVGRSGTGKSTLVNALFNSGVTEPKATQSPPEVLAKATIPDLQIAFLDSRGLEVQTFDTDLKQIENQLLEYNLSFNPDEHVDVVLLLVSSFGTNWEPADSKLVCKIVHEWRFPLAIVFTKWEGELDEYGIDPKTDPGDVKAVNIQRDLQQNNITNVDFFRVNTRAIMKGKTVVFPVAGLERLSEGLKKLVDIGVNATKNRIRDIQKKKMLKEANEIIDDKANSCRARGWAISDMVTADVEISKKMIVRLLEVFNVKEKDDRLAEIAGILFASFQASMVPEKSQLRRIFYGMGQTVDYVTGSSGCVEKMRKLGFAVASFLANLAVQSESLHAEDVISRISTFRPVT